MISLIDEAQFQRWSPPAGSSQPSLFPRMNGSAVQYTFNLTTRIGKRLTRTSRRAYNLQVAGLTG